MTINAAQAVICEMIMDGRNDAQCGVGQFCLDINDENIILHDFDASIAAEYIIK